MSYESRVELILQNILGASNEVEPESRVEKLLQNLIEAAYVVDPMSRVELLLENLQGGSNEVVPMSRVEMLIANALGESYDVVPQSRVEELLVLLAEEYAGVYKTVSGAAGTVITFDDAVPNEPFKSLTLDIDPIQDLNGYDFPWSAGGGGNFLPAGEAFSVTKSGITFTSNGKGTYTIKGTSTGNAIHDFSIPEIVVPDTAYIHLRNDSVSAKVAFAFKKDGTQITSCGPYVVNNILDRSADLGGKTINVLRLPVATDTEVDMTLSPMIMDTNTASEFIPYENICRFSGWAGMMVSVNDTMIGVSWQNEVGGVYSGVVDVVSGVVTVRPYYESYNGETLTGAWLSDRDKYVAGTTPSIGAQVANIGARGIDYHITPREIRSKLGQNEVLTYNANVTVKYLAKKS